MPESSRICWCDLSEGVHIVTSSTCCEICNFSNTVPLTPENTEAAFKFYRDKLDMIRNVVKSPRT